MFAIKLWNDYNTLRKFVKDGQKLWHLKKSLTFYILGQKTYYSLKEYPTWLTDATTNFHNYLLGHHCLHYELVLEVIVLER